jgi:uncharacterized protein YpmB
MRNLRPAVTLFIVMMGTIAHAQVAAISTLGSTITKETGQEWIDNYKARFKALSEHTCSKSMMQEMFCSPEAMGVYLIKGLDQDGNERLVVKPADGNGVILKDSKTILTKTNPAFNDVSRAGLLLDDMTMRQMVEKFREVQKEDELGAHVYGKQVFENLLSQPGASGVYIAKGLDEHNEEHLVLAALDKNGKVMWTGSIWNHGSGIFSIFYPIFMMSLAAK